MLHAVLHVLLPVMLHDMLPAMLHVMLPLVLHVMFVVLHVMFPVVWPAVLHALVSGGSAGERERKLSRTS